MLPHFGTALQIPTSLGVEAHTICFLNAEQQAKRYHHQCDCAWRCDQCARTTPLDPAFKTVPRETLRNRSHSQAFAGCAGSKTTVGDRNVCVSQLLPSNRHARTNKRRKRRSRQTKKNAPCPSLGPSDARSRGHLLARSNAIDSRAPRRPSTANLNLDCLLRPRQAP